MKVFATLVHRSRTAVRRKPGRSRVAASKDADGQRNQMQVRRVLATTRVQAKLEVGPAHDAHEREADALAERILRKPEEPALEEEEEEKEEAPAPELSTSFGAADESVQRQALDGSTEGGAPPELSLPSPDLDSIPDEVPVIEPDPEGVSDAEGDPWPEPTTEELEELRGVQRKARGEGGIVVSDPGLVARVTHPTGGRPLPVDMRDGVQARLPYDYSHVRLHDTPQDRADSAALRARAFTYGDHIWLGPGESAGDRRLLAHELVHVAQQGAAPAREYAPVRRSPRRVQRSLWDAIGAVASRLGELGESAIGAARDWVAEHAQGMSGYRLLTVLLGRDPITDRRVERNATNIAEGVLNLVPGGEEVFRNLRESGAIERAAAWMRERVARLNLGWEVIKGLFRRAWESLGVSDILNPAGAFRRIRSIFAPPLGRLLAFARDAGAKVLEFVFEGALRLAGPFAERVMSVVRRAGATLGRIFDDPIAFGRNLIQAVIRGVGQFKDNILGHLRQGLMGWLFGTLQGAGLQLPERFDLRGIVSIVLQVLGLTYQNLRRKLVRVLGEPRLAALETAFEFLVVLVTQGLAAAWRKLVEYLGNLRDMVIGAVREWVVTRIVTAAVTRLVSMFNPAGAVIQAILAIYNTVVFFIERMQQILALAEAVLNSVHRIAMGQLTQAANFVESAMARTIPVILGFLARLIGLGGISERIKDIIRRIQQRVDRALTRLVNFVVERARALLGRARAAVGRALEWWRQREEFSAGGERHAIYLEGDAANPQVMISSRPDRIQAFLDRSEPSPDQPEALALFRTAAEHYRQLVRAIDRARSRAARAGADDGSAAEVHARLVALRERLAEFMSTISGGFEHPWREPVYGPLNQGMATRMQIEPLWQEGERGSRPIASGPVWAQVVKRRTAAGASHYVLGHLLNEQLRGPGIADNLAPITRVANAQHHSKVESKVKDKVRENAEKARTASDPNERRRAVRYSVDVEYSNHTNLPPTSEMLGDLDPGPRREEIRAILDAERELPTGFACEAWVVRAEGQAYEPVERFIGGAAGAVPNDGIPDDLSGI